MGSDDVVRIARRRAGLTQDQLARRSGYSRETIARWESGAREPTLRSLRGLVRACDLDLVVSLARGDDSLAPLVRDQLSLPPSERLGALQPADEAAHTVAALRWISEVRTPVLVVGGVAAALQGSPQRPGNGWVEIVADDVPMLIDELNHSARACESDERFAQTDRRWPWTLPGGATVVVASALPGSDDYRDLRKSAIDLEVAGAKVRVAHPRDLLRLAEASSRDTERARVPGLRVLLGELREDAQAA
jgi:transcriptional regulator with XRE-family HTH domain